MTNSIKLSLIKNANTFKNSAIASVLKLIFLNQAKKLETLGQDENFVNFIAACLMEAAIRVKGLDFSKAADSKATSILKQARIAFLDSTNSWNIHLDARRETLGSVPNKNANFDTFFVEADLALKCFTTHYTEYTLGLAHRLEADCKDSGLKDTAAVTYLCAYLALTCLNQEYRANKIAEYEYTIAWHSLQILQKVAFSLYLGEVLLLQSFSEFENNHLRLKSLYLTQLFKVSSDPQKISGLHSSFEPGFKIEALLFEEHMEPFKFEVQLLPEVLNGVLVGSKICLKKDGLAAVEVEKTSDMSQIGICQMLASWILRYVCNEFVL